MKRRNPKNRVMQLVKIARSLAQEMGSGFFKPAGFGRGNKITNKFMKLLNEMVKAKIGSDCKPTKFWKDVELETDFYLKKEKTIVEVALGLAKSNTEFEKDILKALLAKEKRPVKKLVFICKPGGEKKCNQPGRKLFLGLARRKGLEVKVYDLK